jgi:hypothetical protein
MQRLKLSDAISQPIPQLMQLRPMGSDPGVSIRFRISCRFEVHRDHSLNALPIPLLCDETCYDYRAANDDRDRRNGDVEVVLVVTPTLSVKGVNRHHNGEDTRRHVLNTQKHEHSGDLDQIVPTRNDLRFPLDQWDARAARYLMACASERTIWNSHVLPGTVGSVHCGDSMR